MSFQNWSTYDLLITAGVGIAIGVTLSLLSIAVMNNNKIAIGNTTYEVVVEKFLGYDELIVARRVNYGL
jgi:ABC-type lipoprotein release transport system permease subunit